MAPIIKNLSVANKNKKTTLKDLKYMIRDVLDRESKIHSTLKGIKYLLRRAEKEPIPNMKEYSKEINKVETLKDFTDSSD